MASLSELPHVSRVVLYGLMTAIGLLMLALAYAQISLLRGRPFQNPDGTSDDWREQKIFFGMAWADLLISVPLTLSGLFLAFSHLKLGLFILGATAVWMVWVNLVTTLTSLRFEEPRITLSWLVVFPLGMVVGLAFLVWLGVHFDHVFG